MKENLKPCVYKLWKHNERCSESVFDEADDPLARSDDAEKSGSLRSKTAMRSQLIRRPRNTRKRSEAKFPSEEGTL